MCSRKAAIALLKTEHIVVGARLLKQLDLLADELEPGEHLDQFHAVCLRDRRRHVRRHDRGDKRRILRHSACRLALSQNVLGDQHTGHVARKCLVLSALRIERIDAKPVRVGIRREHDIRVLLLC